MTMMYTWWRVCGLQLTMTRDAAKLKKRSVKRSVRVWNAEGAEVLTGKPVKVICWNVQYCAGIRQHFFYDGGQAVSTPKDEVLKTTNDIGKALKEMDPDIVLLQEVDRRARRTGYIDEFKALSQMLPEYSRASASYWRVPYVPSPKQEHLGRVGMHLATFSRYKIHNATRWKLPLIKSDSRLKKLFNLRRCALETHIGDCAFINTHLSAFSGGDGTLNSQLDVLRAIVTEKPTWLLAGDFNSLAPWQSASDLDNVEAALYPEGESPVASFYRDFNPALSPSSSDLLTYKPFTSSKPDRTIDHAFASSDISFSNVTVVDTGSFLSDHQPLQLDLRFS